MQVNLREWSDSWLTSPGCAEFELKFDRDASTGLLSNLKLVQTPYNTQNIQGNKLRVQALNIASLDENMQIIDV